MLYFIVQELGAIDGTRIADLTNYGGSNATKSAVVANNFDFGGENFDCEFDIKFRGQCS